MPIFRKIVVRPGSYLVNAPDGKRSVKTFTKDDIDQIATTGNEMIHDGHLIPAPFGHRDPKGVHPIPLTMGTDGNFFDSLTGKKPRWDQAINAGFWKKFEVSPEGALVGYLEADGDEKDDTTHAGKIGKTFVQTSPLLLNEWVDGKGKVRKQAPLHICVTNKAVEPNQSNFETVDPSLALAMSFSTEDLIGGIEMSDSTQTVIDNPPAQGNSDTYISKLKTEFKAKLNLTLPDDTNSSNIFERLFVILANLDPQEKEGLNLEAPKGSEVISSPTIMANDPKVDLLLNYAVTAKKASCKDRISKLVATGRVGKDYAEKNLYPLADAIAMSLDDMGDNGEFIKTPIEMSLDILDSAPSLTDSTPQADIPQGSTTLEHPAGTVSPDVDGELSDEEMNALFEEVLPIKTYAPTI